MDRGNYCAKRETFGISINNNQLIKTGTWNCTSKHLNTSDVFSFKIRLAVGLTWLILILIGAVANIMVLIVIASVKKMRTIANWLLFNLAIADCIMVVVAIPILAVFQTFYYPIWRLPNWSCYVLNCFTHIAALASGASLTAISLHRFIVIRLTNKVVLTKWHLFITVAAIWVIALAGSFTSIANASVVGMIRPISGHLHMTKLCLQLHTNQSKESLQVAFRLFMYITFALFLSTLYSNIGLFLCRSKSPGHPKAAGKSDVRKRQAVKMLATATAVMIITYFPYMVLVAFILFSKSGYFSPVFGIEIFGNILTTVNHVCNPFIYCAFSSQFREGFKIVFNRIINSDNEMSLVNTTGKATDKKERKIKKTKASEFQLKPINGGEYSEITPTLGPNKAPSQLTLQSTFETDTLAQVSDSEKK